MRQRLLIVDADAGFRLGAIARLREHFDASAPAPGDDVVKLARALRPEVALFAAGGRHRVEALRAARVLKTDVRVVPHLGFYSRPGEEPPPRAALEAVLVDGYVPDADADALAAFVAALAAGARPWPEPWPTASPGPLRRVLTRVLGR